MLTETLIIAGGLSGLSLASEMSGAGHNVHLVEARGRLGGRILTEHVGDAFFDLGPAWFWPGQPRMARLVDAFGLRVFEQFADGALTYEDEQGRIERARGFSSMEGSYRLEGGLGALVDALAARIPDNRISLSCPVTHLERTQSGIVATGSNGFRIEARQVVLALPPRLASGITFAPALPEGAHQAMDGIATWMAGQAKAVAVYDAPFWRHAGLSGDAMSRFGPMVEIHDASPRDPEGPGALFGFVGVPPLARQDRTALEQAIVAQLTRLFGPDAAAPKALFIADWAFDAHTATSLDLQPLYAHPAYGLPSALDGLWNGRLIFAGTETAPQFGGYLEGALEAAENALTLLLGEHV